MSNISLLIVSSFRNGLSTSKKSQKQTSAFLTIILIGLLMAVVTFLISFLTFRMKDVNKDLIALDILVGLSFITIMICFFQMHTVLFRSKDFAFLTSLPIRSFSIVFSKVMALILMNLIIDSISMLPVLVNYIIFSGTGMGIISIIIGTLFASVIPLLATTLVGALVSFICVKSSHSDVLTIIFYTIFFVIFAGGIGFAAGSQDILNNFYYALPYFYFLKLAFAGDGLSLFWFILINVGSLFLILGFVSLVFSPINQMNQKISNGTYKKKNKTNEKTSLNIKHILFKKEMNLVIKNPTFMLSSYIAPIFIIVSAFIGFFASGLFFKEAKAIESALNSLRITNLLIGFLFASICATTYASFSFEGKNFANLLVYPIPNKEVIRAKIKASVIPLGILFTIAYLAILLTVGFVVGFEKITISMWLACLLLPLLCSVSTSLIGALCGLRWPRLDFIDPNDVLKKSKSMGMTFLFSFIANTVAFVIYLIPVMNNVPRESIYNIFGVAGSFVYLVVLIIILSIIIHKKGNDLFLKVLER